MKKPSFTAKKRKQRRESTWRRSAISFVPKPSAIVLQLVDYNAKTHENPFVWRLLSQKYNELYLTPEIMLCMCDCPKPVIADIVGVSDTFLKKHRYLFTENPWNYGQVPTDVLKKVRDRRKELINVMIQNGNFMGATVLSEAQMFADVKMRPNPRPSQLQARAKYYTAQPEAQETVELTWDPIVPSLTEADQQVDLEAADVAFLFADEVLH